MILARDQLSELAELLVQHFDDEGRDLDKVVKYNLGSGLFVDYAARGRFRTVVDQLLEKTEQKGSTAKLFEGVLRVRNNNPDVRATIARIFPLARLSNSKTEKDVADAALGVGAVHARLGMATVHDLLVASRNDLERLARD